MGVLTRQLRLETSPAFATGSCSEPFLIVATRLYFFLRGALSFFGEGDTTSPSIAP